METTTKSLLPKHQPTAAASRTLTDPNALQRLRQSSSDNAPRTTTIDPGKPVDLDSEADFLTVTRARLNGRTVRLHDAPETVPAALVPHRTDEVGWTFDEMLRTPFAPIRWAVPGILPEGFSILAGRPKLGKSWLALQIAQAVATGGRVFDVTVSQGAVLLVALEDSPRRLQSRMRMQVWAEGSHGKIVTRLEPLGKGGLGQLEQCLAEEYRLVVIDTLSRALGGQFDSNSVDEMTAVLGRLQELAHESRTAILVIDHHKKGRADDPVDDVMGSTGKAAVADGLLGLYRQRGDSTATLKVTGRDCDEQELHLKFDPIVCCWQMVTDEHGIKANSQQARILSALEDLDGEATLTQVAGFLDRDKSNVAKELAELVAKCLLTKTRKGRETYYSLTERESP